MLMMEHRRRSDHDRGHYGNSQKRKSDHDHHHESKRPRMDNDRPRQHSSPFKPNGYSNHSSPQKIPRDELPDLPFITPEFEKIVFTHSSMTPQASQRRKMQSYDRLEFLGDSYIQIISSRLIWSLYNDHGFSAARMSQVREMLVKNETLSEYSVGYGFDRKLSIGSGAKPDLAATRIKLNGDVFEAFVAAVVLSDPLKGFEAVEDWLAKLWEPRLRTVSLELPDEISKGELQKKIGAKGVRLEYKNERDARIDKRQGIETYFIGVYLTGWGYENKKLGCGQGQSKKAAGMAAAKDALENTKVIDDCMQQKEEMRKLAEEENTAQEKAASAGA